MQTFIDETGCQRLRDTELVLPIIVGTVAFPLGKKATESQTHRWTVYLRGLNNEDLSHVITRVQFDLHPTFNNANRVVDAQPYEVTEHGWGEFEILVHVYFALDSGENEAIIYHRLRLYDDGEQIGSKQDPKKAVVFETYEEIVFSEPRLEFYRRMTSHHPVPLNPPAALLPYFRPPSEAQELAVYQQLRSKVQGMIADLKRELGAPPGMAPGMQLAPPGLPPGMPPQGMPPGVLPQMGMGMPPGMHMQPGAPGLMLGGLPGMPGM